MERRQIEYFLAVVDGGSFTAAAAALHVAQPSLSQAVKTLEREVGTALFHRLPRGVRPTPAGVALLGPARQVVRDLQTARAAVQEVTGLQGGTLDVATLPALTLEPLAKPLASFRGQYPEIQVVMTQPESSALVAELVATGHSELGFLDAPYAHHPDLTVENIATQELWATFPPSSAVDRGPVDWEEMFERGLIAGAPGTLVRDLVDTWAADKGMSSPSLRIELGRRETGMYLVLAGAGVAAFPTPFARMAQQLGAVIRPIPDAPGRSIIACYRSGELSPAARAFLEILRRHRDVPDVQI